MVGVPDADLGQAIVAFVVADGRHRPGAVRLRGRRTSRCTSGPGGSSSSTSLPRNAMGKVQKARLPAADRAASQRRNLRGPWVGARVAKGSRL